MSEDPGAAFDERITLDPDHLDGFTMGDPDVEASVLTVFLDQLDGHLDALEAATTDWAEKAHTLKGAARAIGAWALAAEAARAEHTAAPPAPSARRAVMDRLRCRADDTRREVAARMRWLEALPDE